MNNLLIDADESKSEVEEKFYSQAEETLKTRYKGQHLDYAEKMRLYNMYSLSKTKIDDICKAYSVSNSTMNRIIKEFENWKDSSNLMTSVRWKTVIKYPSVQKLIKEYIEKESSWFTSIDVRNYVKKSIGISVSLHQIRRHLKTIHNLSFKKGSSRPISLNTERIALLKQLFWIKLSKELEGVKVLVNLDESSISK